MSIVHRKCVKCGLTKAADPKVTFHRFPNPGKGTVSKARAWAKFAFPDENFSSVESLKSIHFGSKILCGRHFSNSMFTDEKRQKLTKHAIPTVEFCDLDVDEAEYLEWEFLDEEPSNTDFHILYHEAVTPSKDSVSDKVLRVLRQTGLTVKKITKKKHNREENVKKSYFNMSSINKNKPLSHITQTNCSKISKGSDQVHSVGNIKYKIFNENQRLSDIFGDGNGVQLPRKSERKSYTEKSVVEKFGLEDFDEFANDDPTDGDYLPENDATATDDDDNELAKHDDEYDEFKSIQDAVNDIKTSVVKKESLSSNMAHFTKINGQCRCCLKQGLHRVADIHRLLDCFKIKPSKKADLSTLVCEECDEFVSQAKRFLKMTRDSERDLIANLRALETAESMEHTSPHIKVEDEVIIEYDGEVKDEYTIKEYIANTDQIMDHTEDYTIDHTEEQILNHTEDQTMDHTEEQSLDHTEEQSLDHTEEQIMDHTEEQVMDHIEDQTEGHTEDFTIETIDTDNEDIENSYQDTTDITAIDECKPKKKINLREVRENIVNIILYSTIVPFTFNRDPFKYNYFECVYYDARYPDFAQLRKHMEKAHPAPDPDHISAFVSQLQKAVLRAEVSSLKCRLCQRRVPNLDALVEHLVDAHEIKYYEHACDPPHNILAFDFSTGELRCPACQKVHASIRGLLAHMNQHYGSYVCPFCNMKFLYADSFSKHKANHRKVAPIKTVICDKCGVKLTSRRALLLHKKSSECKPPVKVVRQRKPKVVKKPKKIEVNVSTYECQLCGVIFANAVELYEHRVEHLNDSKDVIHRCEICGYMGRKKNYMRRHFKRHWGVKNFPCTVCPRRFVSAEDLKLHSKVHLARFACPLCGDVYFMSKQDCNYHIRTEHADVNMPRKRTHKQLEQSESNVSNEL